VSTQDDQACNALWLDPYQPAGETERARLAAAGLSLLPVRTLEDLRHALKTAKTVVVRLMDSTELLGEVRLLVEAFKKDIPIICRSAPGNMPLAVAAMRSGACHVIAADDYSEQAWRDALAHVADAEATTAAQTNAAKESAPQSAAATGRRDAVTETVKTFVFADPSSQKLLALAQRVAQAAVTTLITGPTGAGKEVLATVIHESSSRASGPFVSLNCGAIPENLMEDMLFGHERGAFTGAHRDHKGIFEQAHGGTVFLDEIGELPIGLQTKLLRVLQEKKVTRLGGQQAIDVDFRLVAATNKDLKQAMLDKEFREDLYFRISTFRLAIPALHQRAADILPLAEQMIIRFSGALVAPRLSTPAQQALIAYPWPGNVRELENVIQRAIVLSGGEEITADHLIFDDLTGLDRAMLSGYAQAELPLAFLPERTNNTTEWQHPFNEDSRSTVIPFASNYASGSVGSGATHAANGLHASGASNPSGSSAGAPNALNALNAPSAPIRLHDAVKSNEHQMILRAIEAAPTKAEAAKMLGISPRTLRYKMAQLKMAGAA